MPRPECQAAVAAAVGAAAAAAWSQTRHKYINGELIIKGRVGFY